MPKVFEILWKNHERDPYGRFTAFSDHMYDIFLYYLVDYYFYRQVCMQDKGKLSTGQHLQGDRMQMEILVQAVQVICFSGNAGAKSTVSGEDRIPLIYCLWQVFAGNIGRHGG